MAGVLYASLLTLLFPLILSWFIYRKTTTGFKVIAWYLSFVFLVNTISVIMRDLHIVNLPLLHIYTILEFAFIATFFYFIYEGKMHKYLLFIIILMFTSVALTNAIVFRGWNHFNTIPRSIECLITIIFCIMCYYQILTKLKSASIFNDPVFWVNTGFLIYFSGALFLFMMSNYILPLNLKLNILVWTIHAIFCDLLYVFIFIGLWKVRKT